MNIGKNFRLAVEVKDGDLASEISGGTKELLAGLTYLAIRVCALAGETPQARAAVLRSVTEALTTIGPAGVEALYYSIAAREAAGKTKEERQV